MNILNDDDISRIKYRYEIVEYNGVYCTFPLLITSRTMQMGNVTCRKDLQYNITKEYFRCYINIPSFHPLYGKNKLDKLSILDENCIVSFFKLHQAEDFYPVSTNFILDIGYFLEFAGENCTKQSIMNEACKYIKILYKIGDGHYKKEI